MSNELSEHRAKKQGHLTPKALIKDLLERVEAGERDIESIVFVYETKEDGIYASWVVENNVTALGLLDMAHEEVVRDFYSS